MRIPAIGSNILERELPQVKVFDLIETVEEFQEVKYKRTVMNLKDIKVFVAAILSLITFSSIGQVEKLSPDKFQSGMKVKDVQLIDVRTPEEYKDKHLQDALNVNINSGDFETRLATLDKSKPVYVYCLAGSRSSAAAKIMREKGFKEVYELEGGINKWIADKKPIEESTTASSKGMTLQKLNELTQSKKLVIVDFNAKWCGPCKMMQPHLDKVAKEKASVVSIISVDADVSRELVGHYKIDALPTLLLFKNSKQLLRHEGYLDEEGLKELVKQYK